MGEDHVFSTVGTPIIFSGRPNLPRTNIGRDVWLGANVFVRCGVSIGDGCVVGAGSVVLGDLPPNSIAAGVPARILRSRFSDIDFNKHIDSLENGFFSNQYARPI